MRPVIARRRAMPAAPDPAPSIWSYRVQRLWLTPLFRAVLRVGVPAFAAAMATLWYFSDEAHVTALVENVQEIRREIESRPEFRVNILGIEGASDVVLDEVRGALALDLPVSSFDLDLDELRGRVVALPAVADADIRIEGGGYLAVSIEERIPALIWRNREDTVLIDAEGHFVAGLTERALEVPLPLVAGEGADRVVAEALALHTIAAPLGPRLRGLVRMGERRWDVILNDGPRIQLPETGARAALDRVLALHEVQEILDRDLLRIDLRNPARMTVQLTPDAMLGLRQLRDPDATPPTGEQRG